MTLDCIFRELSLLSSIYKAKIIAVAFVLVTSCNYLPANDYKTLENNAREMLLTEHKSKILTSAKIPSYLTTKGKYNNLNYNDNGIVNWSPYHHLDRLLHLTITYKHPESKENGNKALRNNIIEGLEYWSRNKPISKNWWFNKIAIPQKITQILILLNNENMITDKLKRELTSLSYFELGSYVSTNRLQLAMNQFLIGIINQNANLITSSRNEILSTLTIGKIEGIQNDYSFHSHGKQLYTYGYGSSFVDDIINFCMYIKNTKFELDQKELDILNSYILYGYLPIIKNDYIDYNVAGRVISRKNALKTNNHKTVVDRLIEINSDSKILEDLLEYKINKNIYTNRYYWTSDYLIHSTPSIYYSVRGISNRTLQAERGNNENIKGGNLSLGSVNIRRKGDEYNNIFATWDWNKIPGTTTTSGNLNVSKDWGVEGKASFVGGLTIPNYSIMTYELNSNGLTANKSYFFFNDIMISLGTNINSNSSKEVYTTVNQTFLGDNVDIYIKNSKQKHPKYFNIVDNNINKIIHNQLLYYFPKSYNIKVMGSNKKGKWSDINVSGSKNDENYDILSIVISHGQKFKNESYSYIVAPFTKSNEDYIKQIEILANDNNIQAVVDNEINMAQIVFLKPTELNLKGVKIKVDKPIVVLIENFNSKNNILHIVDPTQELGDVSINYNNREYNIQLPKGGLLGTALKII